MNSTRLILLVAITTLGYYSVAYLYWNKDFNLITGTLFTIMTISYAVLLGCSIVVADQITKQEDQKN
jgi:hypothetical protein